MYSRLLKKPLETNQSFFLFGPRGTGKTTWLKNQLKNSIYLDLLKPNLYQELLAHPENLTNFITHENSWIILDEIQKIPMLLNEVHRLIEAKNYRFILTGSSARSLRKKGTNLLAGRALLFHLYPLTVLELQTDFDLKKSLNYGHLPMVFKTKNPKEFLESYVQAYLKEEVLQEGLTRNIGNFFRFLEVASFSQGSVLSISEVAREAKVERKVVEGYFQIWEDLLIARRLPVFTKKAKRRLINHQKFYFFDVGVYRTIRPHGILDNAEEIDGSALETLFLQELTALNDYFGFDYQIFYWRTASQLEVDFVLYGPKGFIAIEIKRSRAVHSKDMHSLKAFAEDYPEAQLYLFYGGSEQQKIDDINVIPIEDALKNLGAYL